MDAEIAQRLDDMITGAGDLPDAIGEAMRSVPRHLFVPAVALAVPPDAEPYLVDRDADPTAWWETVYTGMPIVTQLDGGATDLRRAEGDYTSSASGLSSVAHLLGLLDPAPGHRVLEIGTGTGWTAALLAHLVGEDDVTSIEVDPAVAEQAAKNLAGAGRRPFLVVGDGAAGSPGRAPFDRVHVTCGIRQVPYAWIEQTRPGGVIVAPFCPGFGVGHGLRLVVMPDGTATGRFRGTAEYMMLRAQRFILDLADPGPDGVHRFTTPVDPRAIAWAPPGADLVIWALTGLRSYTQPLDGGHRVWVVDPADPGHWAAATWRPGGGDFEAYQIGDRPVWQEVVDAYFRWAGWGEPAQDRFGATVARAGLRIWRDTPDSVIAVR